MANLPAATEKMPRHRLQPGGANGAWKVGPDGEPETDHLICETDEPVDSFYHAKQHRLLVDALNSSWDPGQPFYADSDIGIFMEPANEGVVAPDFFLTLGVTRPDTYERRKHRAYFVWFFGKVPDAVVEVCSKTKNDEYTYKLRRYEEIGVRYCVIYDPDDVHRQGKLNIFEIENGQSRPIEDNRLAGVGLSVTTWSGSYENWHEEDWLRWADLEGNLIPTGAERAEMERARADRLAEKLRAAGIDPESI